MRRGEVRAAVEPGGVATVGVPRACGVAKPEMQAAAFDVLVEPPAQPRPFAQQRLVRNLDRAVRHRQQRRSASRSTTSRLRSPASSASSIRRRTIAPLSSSSARRSISVRAPPAARGRAAERVLGEARDGALDAAAARVRGEAQARPSRPLHSSSSAVDSSGSAPGRPSTSVSRASTSSGSTLRPTRCAGRSIARRSSSRDMGPTSTWLAPSSRDSSGYAAQRP